MPLEITLPQLNDATAEVTIERYYKQIGEQVAAGDPLVVVRSDRFEWDIPATAAGVIDDLLAQPGATVAIGAALVRLGGSTDVASAEVAATNGRLVRATPAARKIAATHGVDLAIVQGSGPSGTIKRVDVLSLVGTAASTTSEAAFNSCFALDIPTQATITAPQPQPGVAQSATETGEAAGAAEVVPDQRQPAAPRQMPLSVAQRVIAEQLVQSKLGVPQALTAVEVELSRVMAYVGAQRAQFAKRRVDLSVTSCIAYTAVTVLTQQRMLNSVWSDEGVIVRGRVTLGVMTGQGADSLIGLVPNAADLSLQGMARAIGSRQSPQADQARIQAATFTICDEGATRWRHGVVPAGQGAILTIGAIERRPFVLEGPRDDTIVIRPLAILTLAYDARCVTQSQADLFLTDLKSRLEHFSPL